MRKSGFLRHSFPVKPSNYNFITLEEWRTKSKPFFFNSSEEIPDFALSSEDISELIESFHDLEKGTLKLFSGNKTEKAFNYWHQNPENGFTFDPKKHWTEINEFGKGQGDIKYVWEKGRFCFLHTIIRYDHHTNSDNSRLAFSLINSFIKNNQLNCGPHFKCSQEIALRVLNWIFALYYYRNSKSLDDSLFSLILNSIYDQTVHVRKNLSFASIAVRNNHIISEALVLYTVGTLFPWLHKSEEWKKTGKKILEREGLYQIYDDGSYLQHSHNYHRVVLQLYTWALRIAKVNDDSFSDPLINRLHSAVEFLYSMQNESTGRMPNYGANDGSWFFPLNSCAYNDYRPQIDALNVVLSNSSLYEPGKWNEDLLWFGIDSGKRIKTTINLKNIISYKTGGYFILQSNEMKSIIRCASFRNRPAHSDNLHLDLWYKDSNIICDRGSFSYNSSPEVISMFLPSMVHNTASVDNYDQMLKGPRFIWLYWTEAVNNNTDENEDYLLFSGAIKAFRYLKNNGIIHQRTVKHYKYTFRWDITDKIEAFNRNIFQCWNISNDFFDLGFNFRSIDENGKVIMPEYKEGFFSETYGVRSVIKQVVFSSKTNIIHTTIEKR
jgi:hypothetical protein